jgi:hypothetical protein
MAGKTEFFIKKDEELGAFIAEQYWNAHDFPTDTSRESLLNYLGVACYLLDICNIKKMTSKVVNGFIDKSLQVSITAKKAGEVAQSVLGGVKRLPFNTDYLKNDSKTVGRKAVEWYQSLITVFYFPTFITLSITDHKERVLDVSPTLKEYYMGLNDAQKREFDDSFMEELTALNFQTYLNQNLATLKNPLSTLDHLKNVFEEAATIVLDYAIVRGLVYPTQTDEEYLKVINSIACVKENSYMTTKDVFNTAFLKLKRHIFKESAESLGKNMAEKYYLALKGSFPKQRSEGFIEDGYTLARDFLNLKESQDPHYKKECFDSFSKEFAHLLDKEGEKEDFSVTHKHSETKTKKVPFDLSLYKNSSPYEIGEALAQWYWNLLEDLPDLLVSYEVELHFQTMYNTFSTPRNFYNEKLKEASHKAEYRWGFFNTLAHLIFDTTRKGQGDFSAYGRCLAEFVFSYLSVINKEILYQSLQELFSYIDKNKWIEKAAKTAMEHSFSGPFKTGFGVKLRDLKQNLPFLDWNPETTNTQILGEQIALKYWLTLDPSLIRKTLTQESAEEYFLCAFYTYGLFENDSHEKIEELKKAFISQSIKTFKQKTSSQKGGAVHRNIPFKMVMHKTSDHKQMGEQAAEKFLNSINRNKHFSFFKLSFEEKLAKMLNAYKDIEKYYKEGQCTQKEKGLKKLQFTSFVGGIKALFVKEMHSYTINFLQNQMKKHPLDRENSTRFVQDFARIDFDFILNDNPRFLDPHRRGCYLSQQFIDCLNKLNLEGELRQYCELQYQKTFAELEGDVSFTPIEEVLQYVNESSSEREETRSKPRNKRRNKTPKTPLSTSNSTSAEGGGSKEGEKAPLITPCVIEVQPVQPPLVVENKKKNGKRKTRKQRLDRFIRERDLEVRAKLLQDEVDLLKRIEESEEQRYLQEQKDLITAMQNVPNYEYSEKTDAFLKRFPAYRSFFNDVEIGIKDAINEEIYLKLPLLELKNTNEEYLNIFERYSEAQLYILAVCALVHVKRQINPIQIEYDQKEFLNDWLENCIQGAPDPFNRLYAELMEGKMETSIIMELAKLNFSR